MKISEARQLYSAQISSYQEQRVQLAKRKEELDKKIKLGKDDAIIYANEAAILEHSMEEVDKKLSDYRDYMSKVNEQWLMKVNMLSAQQQGDAAKEATQDMVKVMEVARRIMKGAKVPPQDEKKLIEYSPELYQAAKNIGSMAKRKEKEEYDSLWKEKKKIENITDPVEAADNSTVFASGPEIVDVSQVVESVQAEN